MTTVTRRELVTGEDPDEHFPAVEEELFIAETMRGEPPNQFAPAPDIERIASALIAANEREFGHLQARAIVYLWKAEGGARTGKATLGKCQKPSGLLRYFAGHPDFVIWIAADHVRELGLTRWQVEALVFHELCHAIENEHGGAAVAPHEVECFTAEIKAYGAWNEDLGRVARAVQGSLFDGERFPAELTRAAEAVLEGAAVRRR